MRQQYVFQPSKLDELNEQIVFFFQSIYFQSLTIDRTWNNQFIHYKFRPIYNECTKLRTLMKEVHYKYALSPTNDQFKIHNAALNSSNIASICDLTINSLHRKDLSQTMGNSIHKLFKYLYYQLPQTKIFKSTYGELIDHYNALKKATNIKMCPFCGLEPIKPLKSKTKQTYDHYLSLSEYPLHGISTKNFVPTCKTCNEDYKTDKDSVYLNPLRTIRRKLFYPYGHYNYKISVSLSNVVLDTTNTTIKVNCCDVDINCDSINYDRELKTWLDIYEIDTRYKNTIEDDSDEWHKEYFDFQILKTTRGTHIDVPSTFADFMDSLEASESTTNSFIKRPYFDSVNSLTTVFK
ncbi:MAG: hypothetical protein ABJK28_15055 [Algibacter sp.]